MSHRTTASAEARRLLSLPGAVILDSETTDLRGYFCQISILGLDGTPLLDTLVNPCEPINAGARRIHGISDSQVADAPTFAQIEPGLRTLLHDKDVIVYNVGFDRDTILFAELIRFGQAHEALDKPASWRWAAEWMDSCRWHCCMHLYAEYVGQRSRYGGYRWQSLPGGDHSATGDCKAVLSLLKRMAESE